MQIFNALDIKAGKAKGKTNNRTAGLYQPLQFLPEKEKDEDWSADCMNWLEFQGMKQLRRNSKRLMKNYKLAKGIIDKADYIVEENNEFSDLIDVLTKEDESALELKFYPIIPNVINVLCSEFSKRVSKIMFRAIDDYSYNEMLEEKRQMIEDVLLQEAQQKMQIKMMNMGIADDSDQAKQMMDPQNLKSLPEIEQFFQKSYRSMVEEWATHQQKIDEQRFRMSELEERAFRDSLITDREFWHFKMMEDDYEVELWNPLLVFYHKSPGERYMSNANHVGMIELLSLADTIDKYGWMMNQEQLESLEAIFPVRSASYNLPGLQNDGSFYDPNRSHEWNTETPSLAMRQFTSYYDNSMHGQGDIVQWLLSDSEDFFDFGNVNLLRVTTTYWKSQRKVGHLTKITEEGEIIQDIVTEDYKITDKPIYNTVIYKIKSKDNLIFGEHIDWIWINDTWGGIKIGPNRPAVWGNNNPGGMNPIYLGLKGGIPSRLPFQFKGDNSLYGCKIPVEGAVFSDRNTKSVAMVDMMKPFQIGYNIVNNQIADILVDELGTVIMLDQNAVPRHSMGEDWGKNNLAKAYVAMKNFQMLPLDTSITNTENALNFQHYQVLNLEQTNRLLSRVQLASYFKNQAFEVVGLNPQRLGQEISQETATGVEQAVNASYAQTEVYFTQHSDHLMPRVHQMRTDLAQYYNSTKPSIRLQYITSNDEKVNFQINGTKLLLRDINVFCTTNTNTRSIMDQLKQMVLTNNTLGASIFDLGNIIKAESLAEVTSVLKSTEEKTQAQRAAEQKQEQDLQQQQLESQEKQKEIALQFEADQKDKDRAANITIAEIRAAAMSGSKDLNGNNQNDYLDALGVITKQQNFQDSMDLKREQENTKNAFQERNMELQREKIEAERHRDQAQLDIARTNKNSYDKSKKK